MAYVSERLITEETPLEPNYRIVLGKHLAFRFVEVGTELPRASDSRILDWELCSKEFRQERVQAVERGAAAALVHDNSGLQARCEDLEARLQHACGGSWVMLTNLPSTYCGALLWPFDLRKHNSEITIGPQGDVQLPFLVNTAAIKHTMDGLVFQCGSANVLLTNGPRFTAGSIAFAISLDESVVPSRVCKEDRPKARESPETMLEMQ
ncbi:hypothetical protein Q4I30_005520 [Leishmania utingensis]|uniref:Uncharacterized protein n=1 Tax=Leishmania utingensis TaxID=653362 RepID=A0AAW3AAX2_9TRYP